MARKYVDCAAPGCTLRISAANDRELETVVVDHAVRFHQGQDTPEFHELVRQATKEEQG